MQIMVFENVCGANEGEIGLKPNLYRSLLQLAKANCNRYLSIAVSFS
jgi:hypothetical protein